MEEEDATISRIIADLEEALTNNPNPDYHQHHQAAPISHTTLADLQNLLDTNDPDIVFRFFDHLSSKKSLSASSLVPPISSAMDSGPSNASLSASKLYLSLLLSPDSPVFTLFTPMAFLSLLRSIRRSLKKPQQGSGGRSRVLVKCKKKRGTRNVGMDSDEFGDEDNGFDSKTFFSVLKKLESAMGLIHLNRFPDCLKSLIQTVAEIPVLSLELGGFAGSYSSLTDLCGRILSKLMRNEHGSVESTAAEVLKSLRPLILMGKSQARTFALGFLRNQMMVMAKESEEIKKAIVNLPKYLVNKAPEKAEPRGLAVEAIAEIVKAMEVEDQIGFAEYTVKMTRGNANLRLLAVDLILTLMMPLRDPLGVDNNLDGEVNNSWGLSCLEALIHRCSDSSAVIRARALSNLAQLVDFFSTDDRTRLVLKQVIGSEEGEMNGLLRKRCTDEKAAVRKAALLLITKVTGLLGGSVDGVVLKTMGVSCSDSLVSIRKAAIGALSEVSSLSFFM